MTLLPLLLLLTVTVMVMVLVLVWLLWAATGFEVRSSHGRVGHVVSAVVAHARWTKGSHRS